MSSIDYKRLRAFIFDMDGVIINGMPYHARAWQDVFKSVGLDVTAQEVYEREGESGPAAVAHFLRQRGVLATPERVIDLIRRKEELFKRIAKVEPFQGVPEFLARLQRAGKRLALVTGTARHELEISLPPEIQRCFEVVVTGDEVQNGKPDPEPYQRALNQLGIQPYDAVVIENAPLGIQSARAAGLRCLAVETSLACARLVDADQCFPDLPTLAHYVSEQLEN